MHSVITYQQRDPDLDDSPSVQNLLQQQAAMYDGSASSYDAARFTDYPGRYDLLEAEVFIRELNANVMRTLRQGWRALDVACGNGKAAVTLAQTGGHVTALGHQ